MKKYGNFTEEIKCMMAVKLADFVNKHLEDLDLVTADTRDIIVAVSVINGAANIVDEIIEELGVDEKS